MQGHRNQKDTFAQKLAFGLSVLIVGFCTTGRAQTTETAKSLDLKWDAFVDVEGRLSSDSMLPSRGFTVNDGALYLQRDFNRAKAYVGLPFFSDVSGGTNRFVFADQRAQAYIEVDRWAPWSFTLGQYETFLGIERNASRDRFFANVGLLKSFLLPSTHTGFLAIYQLPSVLLRAQLTDPSGAGSLGQANPEIGLQASTKPNAPMTGAVGLTYNQAPVSAVNGNTNLLVDFTGAMTVSKTKIQGEFDFKEIPNSTKVELGLGVFGSHPFSESVSFGGRFELLSNPYLATLPNNGGVYDSAVEFAAGPLYRFERDLIMRGDLGIINYSVSGNNSTSFVASLSLVAEI